MTQIEIDIEELAKAKKRVWVKATSKRKGHYREQEVGEKEKPLDPKEYAWEEVKKGDYPIDKYVSMYGIDAMEKETFGQDGYVYDSFDPDTKIGQSINAMHGYMNAWIKDPSGETNEDLKTFLELNPRIRDLSVFSLYLASDSKAKRFKDFLKEKIIIYKGGSINLNSPLNSFTLDKHTASRFGDVYEYKVPTDIIYSNITAGEAEILISN